MNNELNSINIHKESIKILEEQTGREKELFMKVKDLERQLAEQEIYYASAISRASRAETKLKIIKEALDI